jgi:hypothetical protein
MEALLKLVPLALSLALALPTFTGAALADDRKPTPEERTRIEQTLRDAGYVNWEKIEFDKDDDRWEVEDAETVDGTKYDIKLHAISYGIVSVEKDD